MEFDWQKVLDRNPQGYCETQDQRAGCVYHGPIESVKINEMDFVVIRRKWVAQMPLPDKPGFGRWKKGPDEAKEVLFPNFVVPFIIEPTPQKGYRVRFGLNLIYLDQISGIDPRAVEGLELPAV